MPDIEQRLANLEARNAISELRARYCWYTVRAARADVTALFAEDAVFENTRNAAADPIIVVGRAALFEFFARMKPARRIPLVMNEVIRIDGDTAEGTCAMMSLGEDHFCGHYIDRFVRQDGFWLFARRQFFPYWPDYRPDASRADP